MTSNNKNDNYYSYRLFKRFILLKLFIFILTSIIMQITTTLFIFNLLTIFLLLEIIAILCFVARKKSPFISFLTIFIISISSQIVSFFVAFFLSNTTELLQWIIAITFIITTIFILFKTNILIRLLEKNTRDNIIALCFCGALAAIIIHLIIAIINQIPADQQILINVSVPIHHQL